MNIGDQQAAESTGSQGGCEVGHSLECCSSHIALFTRFITKSFFMLLIFDREIKISPILIQDIWFCTTTGNTEYKGSLSLLLKDQILSLKLTRNSLSLIPHRICTADLGSPKYQSEHTYP